MAHDNVSVSTTSKSPLGQSEATLRGEGRGNTLSLKIPPEGWCPLDMTHKQKLFGILTFELHFFICKVGKIIPISQVVLGRIRYDNVYKRIAIVVIKNQHFQSTRLNGSLVSDCKKRTNFRSKASDLNG